MSDSDKLRAGRSRVAGGRLEIVIDWNKVTADGNDFAVGGNNIVSDSHKLRADESRVAGG